MNRSLVKSFAAGGAIGRFKLVALSGSMTVVQANGATAAIVGVSDIGSSVASGNTCDVLLEGIGEVKAGGTIAAGAYVTADANGDAVAIDAAPAAGTRIAGQALEAAVVGDVIRVHLGKGIVIAPA